MPSIPRIKKSDIPRWTDEVYFQRGLKYYEQAPSTNSGARESAHQGNM
jgi:hypothetical protein